MKNQRPSGEALQSALLCEDKRYRQEIENAMQVQRGLLKKVEKAHEERRKRILGELRR